MVERADGLPHGAWVLIADGEKALFLVNAGDAQDMHLQLRQKEEQENPQAQDWAANRPGRFNDGPSVHRSAVQDTDWHVLEKERFAHDLAEMLYQDAHSGKFDKLVIIASRVVLSELRQELHQEVTKRLILDVPKVLTNHPIEEVEKLLSRELEDA
ncbi:baeRF12 domain-containing protein [Yoonia litorea]|uniref:Protein required for attachment to host cells n=1 Tax=Yoonia litorea TaxID=1123755 RepID=A0A1I6N009_9RHOB|nr:host attachment family protein [Yoonia litorea]SFS21264.1 Protein required for attachment to host cells [Yoonia litorea]